MGRNFKASTSKRLQPDLNDEYLDEDSEVDEFAEGNYDLQPSEDDDEELAGDEAAGSAGRWAPDDWDDAISEEGSDDEDAKGGASSDEGEVDDHMVCVVNPSFIENAHSE